jgi:uncharacterized membrane protein (DUF485 family)
VISLRRYYQRRFGYHERFLVAMTITILVVAYVAVPLIVEFVDAVRGYDPAYYEPKDFERQDWLRRQIVPVLPGLSWEIVIDIVLFLLVAVIWLTFVRARSPRRLPPPR